MAHSLSMLTNCYEGAELTLRYEILNSLKWQQATQKYGTLACSAAPAHLGIKLEHSTTQATTTLFGTHQMSRKIWNSLEKDVKQKLQSIWRLGAVISGKKGL